MADYSTPTTELEAVNEMLRAIGESPVNTISSDEPMAPDVDTALRKLRSVSREVQARGWHFNTEIDFPLARDTEGSLTVAPNVLRVDSVGDSTEFDVVQRGQRLYDRRAHSYVFSKNLKATLVILLAFEEMPEAARNYVTVRAARAFQAGAVGSQVLAGLTAEDEMAALALLLDAEGDTADFNMFTDSCDVLSIWSRGGYL